MGKQWKAGVNARHSVDSVASYSSQNHVDRIRAQNFSSASCQDEGDFGSIKTSLFRRSVESNKKPESVISSTSSTRSRLRELVERKSSQDEHKSAADSVGDIQYFENPTETLEFDKHHNSLEFKKSQEIRPKKRKLSKSKEKDLCETKNKKHEKYQSKLAEYYKVPIQLPQDEFYQHLTRSKAAEELLQKRFANSDTEFSGSYGRLCKHKEPEGSNLRRSRSLAVIREETFTDLQLQNHTKNKRSQLIPRARLFDKPCFKDRLIGRAKYKTKEEVLESIYIDSTASCFGDINAQRKSPEPTDNKSEIKDAVLHNDSHHSRSISGSWPNLNEEEKQANLSEDSIGYSRNPSEIDSLDSNYVRKHYNFEAHKQSYKDSSPETERSVTSPNLSKELYLTTDEHCSDTEDRDRSIINTSKLYKKEDNLSRCENDTNESLNTDEINTKTYDVLSIKRKQSEVKVNTELENTIAPIDTQINDDLQSVVSENDESISSPADSITSYISISIASSDKSQKLEFLANSLAEKIDEYCDSQFKENASITSHTINSEHNTESEPIYTQINKVKTFAEIKRDSFLNKNKNLFNETLKKQNNEIYVSNTYIESDTYSTKSNCTSRNITTEPFVTTLIENQYYSLPDINIGKCLRKSERIDAQLRQEDFEDIPCENTYEIAQTHFREILSRKGNKDYGQLNKSYINPNNNIKIKTNNLIYLPDYSDVIPTQTFTKLEDDLKSIITINSSNTDDKDIIYYSPDNHQNEREINEIEGTIRNNKVVSKSESLRLNSIANYKSDAKRIISLSNDNINTAVQGKKSKTGIKKHYSLRQRDPFEDETHRIPSPNTVEKSFVRPNETITVNSTQTEINNHEALISRVQSFKTSADSNITIVPLSGHQTIVIDPPVSQSLNLNDKKPPATSEQEKEINKISTTHISQIESKTKTPVNCDEIYIKTKKIITETCIDTSSNRKPKDPFINIKLNKVVKTTIPKFTKETCDKIASVQHIYEKPPPKLIIKDSNTSGSEPKFTLNQIISNMTRPQVLQVVDSKNKGSDSTMKINTNTEFKNVSPNTNSKLEESVKPNEELKETRTENNVKEKLNNAIKTDIEYQEKLSSVKNYWSKLIEKPPECKDNDKQDTNLLQEDFNNNNNTDKENTKFKQNNDDNKFVPEVSVGSIIKSLESVKIVDSIRKVSQTKLQLWKEETEKVKSDSEIEEPLSDKIVKVSEDATYDNPNHKSIETDQNRDTPEIEIVELSSDDNQNKKTQATLIKAKGYEKGCDEFDHVRYKVMKSELFKNSIIANYRKEAQFDGLLQYLQDYSFQELLVNNNIVIIEPVRTKVEPTPRKNTDTCKIPPTFLKKNDSNNIGQVDKSKNAIRRHFFYHPIRVNKEIIEEELPNPDTVKKVRNLFEDTLKMKTPMTHDPPLIDETIGLNRRATSYRNLNEDSKENKNSGRKKVTRQLTIDTHYGNKKWDNVSLSSGVSSGDLSSNNEYETDGLSSYTQKNLKDNVYSSSEEYLCDSMSQDFCCESQYVSPDILKKIRECGTSVTYYGGKVLNSKTTVSPMTKAIMEEIKNLQKNCSRDCYSCQTKCHGDTCSCLVTDTHKKTSNTVTTLTCTMENETTKKNNQSELFPGFKFKLVKSNSCSSRLELTGTDDNNARNKYRRQLSKEDPPLLHDNGNSVKNKICRLESYNKGITKTPFDTKDNETKKLIFRNKVDVNKLKNNDNINKSEVASKLMTPIIIETCNNKEELKPEETQDRDSVHSDKTNDPHSFEKKYYYVNDNLDETKATTGKFGEMVFEEFEILESCYDSLTSNKSLK